jgi:hypothetical protein
VGQDRTGSCGSCDSAVGVLSDAERTAYLSSNQRKLYETVRYAASKGFSPGDIIEPGLPQRIATRDALAQRGLDELAQVQIE